MKDIIKNEIISKIENRYIFIIILFVLIPLMQLSSQNKKDFKIFNALSFKETPDLSKYGFSKINLIYEDGVISTNYKLKKGDFNWRFIDFTKILKEANKSKTEKNIPVCLDVEYWGKYLYDKNTKNDAEEIYVTLINIYRTIDSKSLVSVFHYGAISKKINGVSNVVYPCYYTHNNDHKQWISMVKNGIKSIQKQNVNNPIYVFIWPQYNPNQSKHDLGYKFIEPDFWRLQLETLYPLCDGIVVWSHYKDENGNLIYFNEKMPWFQETIKFIEKYDIK